MAEEYCLEDEVFPVETISGMKFYQEDKVKRAVSLLKEDDDEVWNAFLAGEINVPEVRYRLGKNQRERFGPRLLENHIHRDGRPSEKDAPKESSTSASATEENGLQVEGQGTPFSSEQLKKKFNIGKKRYTREEIWKIIDDHSQGKEIGRFTTKSVSSPYETADSLDNSPVKRDGVDNISLDTNSQDGDVTEPTSKLGVQTIEGRPGTLNLIQELRKIPINSRERQIISIVQQELGKAGELLKERLSKRLFSTVGMQGFDRSWIQPENRKNEFWRLIDEEIDNIIGETNTK
tara:strand:- start:2731 stop:3603 length:873 start_codon:yes stop_codon:yes gene_type:complete